MGHSGHGLSLARSIGRAREDFHLHQALAAVAHGRADAVGAGVAAADDHDILAFGGDEVAVLVAVQEAAGVVGQEIHGEMDALEVAALDGQVARLGRAGAEHDRVELLEQLLRRIVGADLGVGHELDALGFHLRDARQHDLGLVELHVRDAVHEQAADAVGALEHGDRVAGLVQLGGGAQARRAGADDGDLLARAHFGRLRHDPALFPAAVNDGAFEALDGDGRGVDAEHAGAFAGRRADAAGEVGEVIGLVQPFEGFLPQAAIDQVVPLGDEVVDGAAGGHAAEQGAGVAEGDAAIHAARALLAQLAFLQVVVELVPVADALEGRAVQRQLAQVFDESSGFAHRECTKSGFRDYGSNGM